MMLMEQKEQVSGIPRILIAGVHSNCGKTTVARGLMAALVKRGLTVQPFKVGPDFIDPSHHTHICGRVSRNLDPVMMGETEVKQTFLHACKGADIAIIEGVMGMFDGIDGTQEGSSAHVAQMLKTPVILVISVKGMSGSVHAITEGFQKYNPQVDMKGVILNMVGSPRHKELLQVGRKIDQLGFIPATEKLDIQSRHLGLHMGGETSIPHELTEIIEEHCDVSTILHLAKQAPPIHIEGKEQITSSHAVRIAVARDPAFCFYYQDNLDKLRLLGGEIQFFSPLTDDLPKADLLYLGGGYPELHGNTLESAPARNQIKKAGEEEMPIYAECGGLMYLGKGIDGTQSGSSARWVGLLPVEAYMEKRFQALGYTIGKSKGGQSVLPAGGEIRGHEFHYSRLASEQDAKYAISLTRGKGIDNGLDGIYVNNSIGCYTHAWFSETMAKKLIEAANQFRHQKEKQ